MESKNIEEKSEKVFQSEKIQKIIGKNLKDSEKKALEAFFKLGFKLGAHEQLSAVQKVEKIE